MVSGWPLVVIEQKFIDRIRDNIDMREINELVSEHESLLILNYLKSGGCFYPKVMYISVCVLSGKFVEKCLLCLWFLGTGRVRSLSSSLWTLTHLTALHINNNNLSRIPPEIAKLPHLVYLNLSSNKLRSLPAELGNMVTLRYVTNQSDSHQNEIK